MAGLEGLASVIYHERQQSGSMLCAQHALNSLLQGPYFTAPDLSALAKHLDDLESSYDDANHGDESTNMDDTGFFSVQVLENALKVWGLNLTRWRGEEMQEYQDRPQIQLAFILNLEQHWYTLRRFGSAHPNIDEDPGEGHWFNLNSFLRSPEWVSKTYLGMVLQQAEAEGYSVFAVTQIDPNAPLALPRTEADAIAATLPEPSSASFQNSRDREGDEDADGLEDEDYELQAALQASLGSSEPSGFEMPRTPPTLSQTRPLPPAAESAPRGPLPPLSGLPLSPFPPGLASDIPGHADVDPVTASMERNRVLLQRMREQQEFAHRELWDEHIRSGGAQRAQDAHDEEDEMLQRAIAESEMLARQSGRDSEIDTDHDDDGDGDDVDAAVGQPTRNPYPQATRTSQNRVYDDDDAELQAALKASLEQVPQGWEPPELPPHPPIALPQVPQTPTRPSLNTTDNEDLDSVMSDETSTAETPTSPVSVDEIRRRRLARFGA